MQKLYEVMKRWGLTISITKTKMMAVGSREAQECRLSANGEEVEVVGEFKYLGSILNSDGSGKRDIEEPIAKASRAYGLLKPSVFSNKSLSLKTKRMVYKATVLSTLFYGSETWTTKRFLTRKLESFNNRCLRDILNINRAQQRTHHITSSEVRERIGLQQLIEEMIMERQIQWLGRLARMEEHRMPRQALFGQLRKTRPFHGVKMSWKDRVKRDMTSLRIFAHWFDMAQDRKKWYEKYHQSMERLVNDRLHREEAKR